MNVIDRIQSLLQARGVPRRSVRRELAKTCEISYEAVRQWFSGDTANIRNEHLVSIARKYKVTVDWLLSGDPSDLNKPDSAQERAGSYQAKRAEAIMDFATPRTRSVLERINQAALVGRLTDADLDLLDQIAARFESSEGEQHASQQGSNQRLRDKLQKNDPHTR